MKTLLVVTRNDLRILRRDPVFAITFIIMPLVTMTLTKGAFQAILVSQGYPDATGAEQAVTGAAVLFAFFLVGNVGFGVFREHGWNTWDRNRASPARDGVVLAGKTIVPMLVLTTQLVVLFGVGIGFVGLNVRGSWLALALVVMAFEVCLVCIGVALLAVCTTVMQLTAISNLSAIVLGALGGALVPVATLPGWAQAIAPVTPTYWAMRGLRTTTLEAAGVGDVAAPVLVLFGFALFFACVAAVRLSTGSPKVAWA